MAIDEDGNLYVIVFSDPPLYPLMYKITQDSPPVISLIANLSSDSQGFSSVNYFFLDQGICYYKQALYVPRIRQLTKIDLKNENPGYKV